MLGVASSGRGGAPLKHLQNANVRSPTKENDRTCRSEEHSIRCPSESITLIASSRHGVGGHDAGAGGGVCAIAVFSGCRRARQIPMVPAKPIQTLPQKGMSPWSMADGYVKSDVKKRLDLLCGTGILLFVRRRRAR